MNLLIRSATIIDPSSSHHKQHVDILIQKGKIAKIGKKITLPDKVKEYKHENLHVSPGWFDLIASFGDPGFEYKEDIRSGSAAAAKGGFTGVALRPDTHPALHSKGEVEYIINRSKGNAVELFPVGALSHNREGKDITEMYDMHEAGAVAFSDGDKPITDAGLMLRSLQYVKPFEGLIMSRPENSFLTAGPVNEGEMSVLLGMKGNPSLSEELMVHRDIYLSEYAGSRVHFTKISTADSVKLIKEAKAKGLPVTASVAAHHLLLNEKALQDFDANYKVRPPLRTEKDVKALIKGLKDNIIDIIGSDHTPQDEESKKREFDYAAFGIIGLETAFAVLNTALRKALTIEQIIEKIAIEPRKLLKRNIPVIKEGQNANITLFDPDMEWEFTENDIISRSKNTPFVGRKFTGRPLGIINNNRIIL